MFVCTRQCLCIISSFTVDLHRLDGLTRLCLGCSLLFVPLVVEVWYSEYRRVYEGKVGLERKGFDQTGFLRPTTTRKGGGGEERRWADVKLTTRGDETLKM